MDCLFCKMISKEIPVPRVYEDDQAIVINDINPQAPRHMLVIAKKHFAGINEVPSTETNFFEGLMHAVNAVVKQEQLDRAGYRIVINYGEKAGQSVPHIHIHVLSGRTMKWPPG
jgi:histidine triad (HIT) family protein